MNLTLNIYTDEELKEVKRTAEAERVKIPYRTAINLISMLEGVDGDNEKDLLQLVSKSIDKLDKVVKATFGVSENELDCVDAGELGAVAVELYKWAIDKLKGLKGGESKNSQTAM